MPQPRGTTATQNVSPFRGFTSSGDSPRSRPDDDTLVRHDARQQIVATAWAGCNRALTERRSVYLGGAVRPDRRGEGIGRAVLGWEMAHGSEWDSTTRQDGYGPLVMRLYAPSDQADVRDLAERHELAIERYFFEMSRRLDDTPPAPELNGVRIVDWRPERSPEVHNMVDRAFQDHWGHANRTDEMWDEVVGSRAFRPDWSVLALDETTATVVGAALNCAYEQDWQATGIREGYTDQLAVAHTHRGRGIASALWQSPCADLRPREWTLPPSASTQPTPPVHFGCMKGSAIGRRRARACISSCALALRRRDLPPKPTETRVRVRSYEVLEFPGACVGPAASLTVVTDHTDSTFQGPPLAGDETPPCSARWSASVRPSRGRWAVWTRPGCGRPSASPR